MTDCANLTLPFDIPTAGADFDRRADESRWIRAPRKTDAAAIHRLISECPPLDLNSVYTYLLLCEHFPQTCIVAGSGAPDGYTLDAFISAYLPPERPKTLFVWQVAVHERARGHGLARQLLRELLRRPGLDAIQYIETTVGPDNAASRGMFTGLARQLHAQVREESCFPPELFGAHSHEDEPLLRIGPFGAA
ncbi:MAG: diaminobutyrate acetyltransferase [Burkholderiaceae bacterium]